jgi:hypothetical protein
MAMSISPQVFQTPKTVLFNMLDLYLQDPNISLGTTQPSTPTLSITVNQLPAINGPVAQARYIALIFVNLYNNSGGTYAGYCTIIIGSRNLGTASGSIPNAYYGTFKAVAFVNLNDRIDIYAWGAASGFYLRTVYVLIIPAPKLTTKFSGRVVLQVTKISKSPGFQAGSTTTVNSIILASDDITEATISDAGITSVTNLLSPTIYISEQPPTLVAFASSLANQYILLPVKVVYLT